MKRIKLILQYDGTAYAGWQIQENAVSIQELVEKAIASVTRTEIKVLCAGRTDSGVHAFEQTAVFDTDSPITADNFRQALNANLPQDIRVVKSEECPPDFNPRYRAKHKTYSYIIATDRTNTVFLKRYSWEMNRKLNIDAMRKAAQYLIGKHDFSSFRASGCGASHAVRELHNIIISDPAPVEFVTFTLNTPVIKITIEGSAFLRHMVRIIVGTLVKIGKEQYPPENMKEILDSKDRKNAGQTAPARGLFLEKIDY